MTPDLSRIEPRLLDAAKTIADLARRAGGRALMVGGAVRDMCDGTFRPAVKDVDIEVFGLGAERLRSVIGPRFAFDECGASFGVLKIKGMDIDVSLPRMETKIGEGHKGFLIGSDPSMSVAEAALRRDFTINAMYCDPLTGEALDPCGGLSDLASRTLRHVSERFAEDPLRVLRGMQFVARFGLASAPETDAVCRRMTIENLPPERLFEEWAKFFTKGRAMSKGLGFLRRVGWVRYFPELEALIGCRQDPEWHPEGDVWNHTCGCLDAFARERVGDRDEDVIVGFAVLCHDFGKPATTGWDPRRRRIRSLGHDVAGVAPTISFLRRFTNEERILREVPPLVQHHMRPYAMWKAKVGDAAIRRLALQVGRIDRLVRVASADDQGRYPDGRVTERAPELEWLMREAERLQLEAEAPKPILLGRHLIEMGLTPGPAFGGIIDAVFQAQLDGAFTDLEGAREYFRRNERLILRRGPRQST